MCRERAADDVVQPSMMSDLRQWLQVRKEKREAFKAEQAAKKASEAQPARSL